MRQKILTFLAFSSGMANTNYDRIAWHVTRQKWHLKKPRSSENIVFCFLLYLVYIVVGFKLQHIDWELNWHDNCSLLISVHDDSRCCVFLDAPDFPVILVCDFQPKTVFKSLIVYSLTEYFVNPFPRIVQTQLHISREQLMFFMRKVCGRCTLISPHTLLPELIKIKAYLQSCYSFCHFFYLTTTWKERKYKESRKYQESIYLIPPLPPLPCHFTQNGTTWLKKKEKKNCTKAQTYS